MFYHVRGILHIKYPLLLMGNSNPCGSSGFPLSLSEWSVTICLTAYNRKQIVLSPSLNKIFPSFLVFVLLLLFCLFGFLGLFYVVGIFFWVVVCLV